MKNLYLLLIAGLLSFMTASGFPLNTNSSDAIRLVTNLYVITSGGSAVLLDGTLTQYGTDYSNNLDRYDARKMTNPGENWGMLRNKKVYIVERRHVIEGTDSVFFKMWNMRSFNYRLELITSNLSFPGRTAILQDNFLQTSTPINLNGNTEINFTITDDPASKATDRFRIIFSNSTPSGLLPFEFIFVNASLLNNRSVNVTWQAGNTEKINSYSVEKSNDGIHFHNIQFININSPENEHYRVIDQNPADGDNYYRIASVDISGKEKFSNILKVNVVNDLQGISVFPNPATGANLNLKMVNESSGQYEIRIVNSFGQSFLSKKIMYNGGTAIQKINPTEPVPPGIYQLEIKSPDGSRKSISVVF